MAYASYSLTSTLGAVAAAVEFANTLAGWVATLDGDGTTGRFTPPGASSAHFTLSVRNSAGVLSTDFLYASGTASVGFNIPEARCDFRAWGAGLVGPPSLLHAFGRAAPVPHLAFVFETSPGIYRQIYIGHVDKIGDHVGREIVSAYVSPGSLSTLYRSRMFYTSFLFTGSPRAYGSLTGTNSPDLRGGVRINGAWSKFYAGPTTPGVSGGVADYANFGVTLCGENQFSGYVPISPINLYRGSYSPTDNFWTSIGMPAGVRFVNIELFYPSQAVVLPDGSTWRVFPASRKTPWYISNGSQDVVASEMSGNLGYAFLVDN